MQATNHILGKAMPLCTRFRFGYSEWRDVPLANERTLGITLFWNSFDEHKPAMYIITDVANNHVKQDTFLDVYVHEYLHIWLFCNLGSPDKEHTNDAWAGVYEHMLAAATIYSREIGCYGLSD